MDKIVWVIQRACDFLPGEEESDKWEFLGVCETKEQAIELIKDRDDCAIGPVTLGALFENDYKIWEVFNFVYHGREWDGKQFIDPPEE